MRKICVVVTARPSYSRIKTVLKAINAHAALELQLIASSTALLEKYGNVASHMQMDGFHVTARLQNFLEGENPTTSAKTAGLALIELASIFDHIRPDVVLTVGDRSETIATASCAAIMHIPLAHVQGGEVTGNVDDKIRHAITKLADIHFVATSEARERLLRLGENPEMVYLTGCPSIDIAAQVFNDPHLDFDLNQRYGGVSPSIKALEPYLVVMQHPVTNEYGSSRDQIDQTLDGVKQLGLPTFWFWPNPDAGSGDTARGIRSFRELNQEARIHYYKNMESVDFLKLLKNAACLIGNSSVGIRECSYLGIPVVNIGSRQSGRQRGKNVIDVEHDSTCIQNAVKTQVSHGHYPSDQIYGSGHAGNIIGQVLATADFTPRKKITY
jgi:UDP-hydrolysing UDP-N-acetyl-D-glucosamine 2-epimerase